MTRTDYRQEWTANVKVGDTVILIPRMHFSPATQQIVTKVGHNFIGFEVKNFQGTIFLRKFSRTSLEETGSSHFRSDRIEEYTEKNWAKHEANKQAEVDRHASMDLTRKIMEKVSIHNGHATQELVVLRSIAAILGIES